MWPQAKAAQQRDKLEEDGARRQSELREEGRGRRVPLVTKNSLKPLKLLRKHTLPFIYSSPFSISRSLFIAEKQG